LASPSKGVSHWTPLRRKEAGIETPEFFAETLPATPSFDRNQWKTVSSPNQQSHPCVSSPELGREDSSNKERPSMLMTKERRPAIRRLGGWAISVLQEAGAIRECEEHGWMQDRADPHAWERATDL
jgi:hypothetical protein